MNGVGSGDSSRTSVKEISDQFYWNGRFLLMRMIKVHLLVLVFKKDFTLGSFCIFIRPFSDYGMVMSVRVSIHLSVRQSFPHFSPTCYNKLIEMKFCVWLYSMHFRWSSNATNFRKFLKALCAFSIFFVCLEITHVSALFSYGLSCMEPKLCIEGLILCFHARQIKFESCHFPSVFVGYMALFEPKILEIRSFPHFSSTWHDAFPYWAGTLYITLFSCTSDQVRMSSLPDGPYSNLKYWKYAVFNT